MNLSFNNGDDSLDLSKASLWIRRTMSGRIRWKKSLLQENDNRNDSHPSCQLYGEQPSSMRTKTTVTALNGLMDWVFIYFSINTFFESVQQDR